MKIREGRDRRKRSRFAGRLLMAAAALIALAVWIDSAMRPAIENIIAYQAQVLAVRLVNEAILKQMDESGVDYDKLVTITRGENGDVLYIEADMAQINRFKSQMSMAVVKALEDNNNREIYIPVGTLIGNHFTSGRGPDVAIKVLPTGYVQAEMSNQFESAGINQTLHQIMLNINIQMLAVFPGYSVKTETATGLCVAETIIVGKIPQGYAAIDGAASAFFPVHTEN